jgi:hypothetical protein
MFKKIVFIILVLFFIGCSGPEKDVTDTEDIVSAGNAETTYAISTEDERQALGSLVVHTLRTYDNYHKTGMNWVGMDRLIIHLNATIGSKLYDRKLIEEYAPRAKRFGQLYIGTKADSYKPPLGHRSEWNALADTDIVIMF